MEFSLFVHMERLTPDQPHDQLNEEFIALCKMADDAGMRAVWTGEHHGMEFTIAPNPLMSLVNVAHHTKNVRLGTGTIIAPFWHPIKLAGEAASADLLTGGRIELGIARGAYSYEYERLRPGMDAWEAGQRMREITPLLRKLWVGDCAHEGEFFQFPATTSAPKPVITLECYCTTRGTDSFTLLNFCSLVDKCTTKSEVVINCFPIGKRKIYGFQTDIVGVKSAGKVD